jgi:hypothetical protein
MWTTHYLPRMRLGCYNTSTPSNHSPLLHPPQLHPTRDTLPPPCMHPTRLHNRMRVQHIFACPHPIGKPKVFALIPPFFPSSKPLNSRCLRFVYGFHKESMSLAH